MKNISRRVFIKGLAVAGVAAAASTVLAGCNTNMIPGVGDDQDNEVTEPDASNKYTFTNGDGETLVISAPSVVTSTVGAAAGKVKLGIPVEIDNKLSADVKFVDAAADLPAASVTAGAAYCYVVLTAEGTDKDGDTVDFGVATTAANFGMDNLFDNTNKYDILTQKTGYAKRAVVFDETPKDWASLTITVKVYEPVKRVDGKYVYDTKAENDKGEFKYTR